MRDRPIRDETLLSEDQLRSGVRRMAEQITGTYGGQPLTIIGVLTGSVVLVADLIRQLDMPLRVGVVMASSYRGATTTRGPLKINADLMPDISQRNVLLVDDIFDTGHTLLELLALLEQFDPTSVKTAVLLRKQGRQEVALHPDFVDSKSPTNSSSDTGSTTRTPIAIFLSSPHWRQRKSKAVPHRKISAYDCLRCV